MHAQCPPNASRRLAAPERRGHARREDGAGTGERLVLLRGEADARRASCAWTQKISNTASTPRRHAGPAPGPVLPPASRRPPHLVPRCEHRCAEGANSVPVVSSAAQRVPPACRAMGCMQCVQRSGSGGSAGHAQTGHVGCMYQLHEPTMPPPSRRRVLRRTARPLPMPPGETLH